MVKMGAREFVYPNFGYRSIWLRNRDPVYLESPIVRSQPITPDVVLDACIDTRWHHGAYIPPKKDSIVTRSVSRIDNVPGAVGAMSAELSRHFPGGNNGIC